jgi:hypothetical protein
MNPSLLLSPCSGRCKEPPRRTVFGSRDNNGCTAVRGTVTSQSRGNAKREELFLLRHNQGFKLRSGTCGVACAACQAHKHNKEVSSRVVMIAGVLFLLKYLVGIGLANCN